MREDRYTSHTFHLENNIKNLEKIRNNNLNNAGIDGIKDDNYDGYCYCMAKL